MTKETAPHILLVEDDPESQALIQRYLRREGVPPENIQVASRGDDGMKALEGQDLVIADLSLPGVSGATVVRTARARGIPAYLVSSTTPLSRADAQLCDAKQNLPYLIHQWLTQFISSHGCAA